MKKDRRSFLKLTGLTGIGLGTGGLLEGFANEAGHAKQGDFIAGEFASLHNGQTSLIGAYGPWAAALNDRQLPSLSFRNSRFKQVESWKKTARSKLNERINMPDTGGLPKVTLQRKYEYDGLEIEELNWQLPYGPPTDAILLKPLNAKGKLPAILAFHDHGGLKYFGTKKITRTQDQQHPIIVEHQKESYDGLAWANEIAKKGYVVLVADAFAFASRRVLLKDVPESSRGALSDADPETVEHVKAYNEWASLHEHTMAKSLFSAGTTWPGVFLAEDKKALDILCARSDVDPNNIGCCGLSGGGLRTVFMGGHDDRIKCAICVGFMTTWNDFVLNKSTTHTWMTYVPILPNELDFPEILGLRVPLPTLVLNDLDDELYTLEGMKAADGILSDVYKKAGVPDRYKASYYPGPHKFDKAMQAEAFAWFDRWLKS